VELFLRVVGEAREAEIKVANPALINSINLNWKNKDLLL